MIDRRRQAEEEYRFAQTQFPVLAHENLAVDDRIRMLEERQAHKPRRVRNSMLWAGMPMYYYCKNCEHLAVVMPDGHREAIPQLCAECQSLKEMGAILQGPSLILTSNQVDTLKAIADFVIRAQRSGKIRIPGHEPLSGVFASCSMACDPNCLSIQSQKLLKALAEMEVSDGN